MDIDIAPYTTLSSTFPLSDKNHAVLMELVRLIGGVKCLLGELVVVRRTRRVLDLRHVMMMQERGYVLQRDYEELAKKIQQEEEEDVKSWS